MEDSIIQTRFTSEDLFAIMRGFDISHMVCPLTMTGPLDRRLASKLGKWRRRAVRRLGKAGLVDGEANPCPELAEVLAPLWNAGTVVSDGSLPDDPGSQRDLRNAAVYVLPDGRATLAVRGGGPFGGWMLRALRGEGEVLAAVLSLHGLGGRVETAGAERRVLIPHDPGHKLLTAAYKGRSGEIIASAERWGFDPADLLSFSRWWAGEGEALWGRAKGMAVARRLVTPEGLIASKTFDAALPKSDPRPVNASFTTVDKTGMEITVENGITTGFSEETTRYRMCVFFRHAGFLSSGQRSPLPGDAPSWDADERLFESYDLVASEEQLARTLLMVDGNPADGRARVFEGDGIPLWTLDSSSEEGGR